MDCNLLVSGRAAWAARAAGVVALYALLTGCGTLAPGDTVQLSRDVYDMKNTVNGLKDLDTANAQKTQFALSQLNDGLQNRNDTLKSSMDDIAKRINDQAGELDAMRKKVEEMNYTIADLKKRLDGGASGSTGMNAMPTAEPTPMAMATPLPGTTQAQPTPQGTPATPSMSPVDQAYNTGLRLLNSGQYKEARESLRQAMEQKPDADKANEIQFWLAQACEGDKDYQAALDNYTAVIQAKPKETRSWVSLERMADIKMRTGDNKKALEWLHQIVDVNPGYADIDRVKSKIARLEAGALPAGVSPTPPAQH